MIQQYNESMGGVDLLDSLLSKHSNKMKSKRWYLYIFWHTIRIMLVNAWLSYRRLCLIMNVQKKNVLNQRRFQSTLATSLIDVNASKKRGRPSLETEAGLAKRQPSQHHPSPDVRKDGYMHFPVTAETRLRCKLCGQKTCVACEKFNVNLFHPKSEKLFQKLP